MSVLSKGCFSKHILSAQDTPQVNMEKEAYKMNKGEF